MKTDQILTKQDLFDFEERLIIKLSDILSDQESPKYIRSKDVCKLLNISSSSLQNYRNSGKIPYVRLAGTLLYDLDEIKKLLKFHSLESN